MAKVEMSLQEYNELKTELDFLKRVVKEITTAEYDSWYEEYYKNGQSYAVSSDVSNEVREFLEKECIKNLPEKFKGEFTPSWTKPGIGSITTPVEESTEESNDSEEESK